MSWLLWATPAFTILVCVGLVALVKGLEWLDRRREQRKINEHRQHAIRALDEWDRRTGRK